MYSETFKCHTQAESNLNHAKEKLSELHTEPIERSEVGLDFERRIEECRIALKKANADKAKCSEQFNNLKAEQAVTARNAKKFETEIANYTPKRLDESGDINILLNHIETCTEQLKLAEDETKTYHRQELEPFRNVHSSFAGTLDGILSVIDHVITGDKYFTLYERTEDDIKRYHERITQLAILLKDVEESRKQLVTNCLQRVGRLYENLKLLSKKSTIQINDRKKQMINIILPDIETTSELPTQRINLYITEQVKKYLSEQENASKPHCDYLEIRQLLNCYIGQESIPIEVFKIDKNKQNSGYRAWQNATKANSGGEQFVILFSLIVSIMNYTRNLTNNLNHTSGVLILDNPFGPISSPHLLEPMFRIARHFHIQLICLTHLGTAAVTSFFDMVYQIKFKTLPLSNVEILESEAMQHMEHAYYLSEQLSLF